MGVAGEHQRQTKRGRFGQPSRVVSQQYGYGCGVAGEIGDVDLALRPESDADEIDRLAFDPHPRTRILQHLHAVLDKGRRHLVIVIVVAENAEYAVRRRERGQRLG